MRRSASVARAKAHDAPSLDAALALLTPREKSAALGDSEALERLLALATRPATDAG